MVSRNWLALALLLVAAPAGAQKSAAAPACPCVSFTLDFPTALPPHAVITAGASGRTKYESTGPLFPNAPAADPNTAEFTMSAATRERIFDLARKLDYFQGDFDYKKHPIASSGRKTLRYTDAGKSFSTSYNWSENSAVRELTQIFEAIINTQESARHLTYLHRYDKLGLEAELKFMEEQAKENNLGELQAIAPLLREIADDPAVLHVARQRARRLLARAGVEASPQASSPQ